MMMMMRQDWKSWPSLFSLLFIYSSSTGSEYKLLLVLYYQFKYACMQCMVGWNWKWKQSKRKWPSSSSIIISSNRLPTAMSC